MLKEVVQHLIELGRPSIMEHPGDPTKTLIVGYDGEIIEKVNKPPKRSHSVLDMASLKTSLEKYGEADTSVWVSFAAVRVILDSANHRMNTVTLPLRANDLFEGLQNFGTKKDPKVLYRFLKFDCKDAAIDPADLDLAISNLKFRTEDEVSRELGKSKDNMGQSIRSEVTGADKIPDLVAFTFLPWPGIEEEFQADVTVPCQLYIDPAERTISLKPLAGAMDAARTAAVTTLAQNIREKWKLPECPVLCGTP